MSNDSTHTIALDWVVGPRGTSMYQARCTCG